MRTRQTAGGADLPHLPAASPGAALGAEGPENRGETMRAPGPADVLRADMGRLQRAFGSPQGRSSRTFRVLSKLLDEKRGRYETKIFYCPPLALLWSFLRGDGSPASSLHRFYLRQVWRERGVGARAGLVAATLLWPMVTLGTMVWFTWLNGDEIESRTGKKVWLQMIEQVQLSTVHSILPPWYYMFELFDEARSRHAGEYLHRFETKGGIYRFLKRTPRGATRTPLGDKLRFAAWCRDHGVPTAPVLLVAEKGEFLSEFLQGGEGEPQLPQAELFVKSTVGRGGFGAERWRFEGNGRYADGTGAILTTAELLASLRRRSLSEGCLVQPRLVNHPDIAGLSNGALCTVRILTIENERGEFEPTHAVLRMAIGANRIVDNFHAGGIAAKVDLRAGELGRATDIGLRPEIGWCESHPDTHARICGRVLPFWAETLALVSRAHAAFADRVVIGWDVAILEDGPVVIEGNSGPDLDIVQRTHGEPIGDSRLGELLAFHLRRTIDARGSASDTLCAQGPGPGAREPLAPPRREKWEGKNV